MGQASSPGVSSVLAPCGWAIWPGAAGWFDTPGPSDQTPLMPPAPTSWDSAHESTELFPELGYTHSLELS